MIYVLQLRDETWGLRGKIKKTVVRVVDRAYGLHPDASTISADSDPRVVLAEKKKYIAKKISELLEGPQWFLYGPPTEVMQIVFISNTLFIPKFCP